MPLTREFRETVQARAKRDPAFREAMLMEALTCFLSDDFATGKAMLRDYINATVGFEELAKQVRRPSKSLHRMLAPSGNPNANNLFDILKALQKAEGIQLKVSARRHAA